MFVKIGALSFLVLISLCTIGSAGVCPFGPISPSEVSISSLNGEIANGGTVNGTMFVSSNSLSGVNGDVTGYMSTSRDLLGKGTELLYADTTSVNSIYTGETGISLLVGALTYKGSAMYTFATPDPMCDETNEYTPFCEDAQSNVKIYMNSGEYASTISLIGPASNTLTHNSAMEGIGSYQGNSAFNLKEGCNGTIEKYTSMSDKVTLIGDVTFGRQVQFKSVKS